MCDDSAVQPAAPAAVEEPLGLDPSIAAAAEKAAAEKTAAARAKATPTTRALILTRLGLGQAKAIVQARANKTGHFNATGPEFWEQTHGQIDGFICAVGSGGTLAGTADYLRTKNKDIKIGIADPMGSALYEHYAHGTLKAEGGSVSEGIGQGRITANLEGLEMDMPVQVSDEEAMPILFDLLEKEGLLLGGSSAINVAGAVKMAQKMGPGHTICTILCDSGQRYQSKIWNPDFLRSKNLPVPHWLET